MTDQNPSSNFTRRDWIKASGLGAAALAVGPISAAEADDAFPVAKNGRIKQSLVHWCYSPAWPDIDDLCKTAVKLGCKSIELIDPKHWPTLKKHGLTCAISGSHGFPTGYNNKGEWEKCNAILKERIVQANEFGVKSVITFTGMANGISKEEGADNCVAGLKDIVGFAEKHDVTLCVEMLNTREDSHPMKGHPGYQGDDCEYCIDILKRIGSPNCKLLFDFYHVQIMNGDLIRRVRQHKDWIGHIHTAGNPGRGELDQTQEINYPALMNVLLEVGYTGYVGQEFIPTRDPWAGLVEAVKQCDV
ncbi:MAG TPA: TIM barrel protein [Planctomicrobium sp.]|nr:TIM barrel protein [Planctomicrobium sp.]